MWNTNSLVQDLNLSCNVHNTLNMYLKHRLMLNLKKKKFPVKTNSLHHSVSNKLINNTGYPPSFSRRPHRVCARCVLLCQLQGLETFLPGNIHIEGLSLSLGPWGAPKGKCQRDEAFMWWQFINLGLGVNFPSPTIKWRHRIWPSGKSNKSYGSLSLVVHYYSIVNWGINVNVLDCSHEISKYKLQLYNYVHFQTNTLGKNMNLFILPAMA